MGNTTNIMDLDLDLDALLDLARRLPVSKETRDAQRLSFAYGNASLSNPRITRDSIKEAAEKLAKTPVVVPALK